MSKIETGGPAFPQSIIDAGNGSGIVASDEIGCGGMTLRDYFAAAAVNGIVSAANWKTTSGEQMAKDAYNVADAMLKAREGGA